MKNITLEEIGAEYRFYLPIFLIAFVPVEIHAVSFLDAFDVCHVCCIKPYLKIRIYPSN